MDKYAVLDALLDEPTVVAKLVSFTDKEASNFLKENYGVDFTAEELNEVAKGVNVALADDSEGELDPGQLDEVVGGARSFWYNKGYYFGKQLKAKATILGIIGGLVSIGVISW